MSHPTLFAQAPDTIEKHIRDFFKLADDGVFTDINANDANAHQTVLNSLLTAYATRLSLGPDNIATRYALHLMTGETKTISAFLKPNKMIITDALVACVSALDHPLPNLAETPDNNIDAGSIDAKKVRGERMLVEMAQRDALDPKLSALVLGRGA